MLVARPEGAQLVEARQMHASYWMVQAPELCAVHVLNSMTELLIAAAVTLGIVVGSVQGEAPGIWHDIIASTQSP